MQAKPVGGSGSVKNPLESDLNFAGFKAVAMVCDNGATLPSTPVIGQWFLHTPTGRKILMQYDGSNWIPIISYGTMDLYVDNTDGTDDAVHGTGVDADAFKSPQYAGDTIPGFFSGNIIIHFNAETYSNLILRGKFPTGNFTITLQGTLVADATAAQDSSVQGSGATHGSITDAGAFTNHANKLLYSSNNAQYKIIDLVDANTATVVGVWAAAPTGNYTVYSWGTILGAITLDCPACPVYFYDIHFQGQILQSTKSAGYAYRCKWSGSMYSSVNNSSSPFSFFHIDTCFIDASSFTSFLARCDFGQLEIYYTKILATGALPYANIGFCSYLRTQCIVLDGTNKTPIRAIYVNGNAVCKMYEGPTNGYSIIRNFGTALTAETGGQISNTGTVTFTNNTTDKNAVAASYGYIG